MFSAQKIKTAYGFFAEVFGKQRMLVCGYVGM
jgi:hypothetical protein